MADETRLVLAQILQYSECTTITGLGMDYLEEIFELYFNILAVNVMRFTEANNRVKPTWKDIVNGLEDMVSFEELEAFCKQEIDMDHEILPEVEHPKEPQPISIQELEKDPFGNIASKRIAVPDHFPPFPPPHSYMQTKVFITY
jgi:hypothetical protein